MTTRLHLENVYAHFKVLQKLHSVIVQYQNVCFQNVMLCCLTRHMDDPLPRLREHCSSMLQNWPGRTAKMSLISDWSAPESSVNKQFDDLLKEVKNLHTTGKLLAYCPFNKMKIEEESFLRVTVEQILLCQHYFV